MRQIIELHDSTVSEVTTHCGEVRVCLNPAIIHQSSLCPGVDAGTVWLQEVHLFFEEASMSGKAPQWPCEIWSGTFIDGKHIHDNIFPENLSPDGPYELKAVFDLPHNVTITGKHLRVEFIGQPRYLEDFPGFKRSNP